MSATSASLIGKS